MYSHAFAQEADCLLGSIPRQKKVVASRAFLSCCFAVQVLVDALVSVAAFHSVGLCC